MHSEDISSSANELGENAAITLRLEGFEGPLDLLLHLIKREEIDIWNIPISRITEQYLEYLQLMKELNINLAGEWLVMAASLIYIKSRMLLPPDPVSPGDEKQEGADDPRIELVYQLLEHQKFKNAAEMLHTREEVEHAVWNNPPREVLEEGEGLVSVTLFDLIKAFQEVVKRFENQVSLEMVGEEVSLEQRLTDLRKILLVHETVLFSSFFAHAPSKQHMIVTFLAVLELVRLREIWIVQKETFAEIFITKNTTEAPKK